MKNFLTLAALCALLLSPVHAEMPLTREQAANIKSFDAQELAEQAFQLPGEIVKIKYTRRLKPVEKLEDGQFTGQLGIDIYRSGTARYGFVQVKVPAEAGDWFLKVPTEYSRRGAMIVFARVNPSSQPMVELIGRELKTDAKGSRIVW